MPTYVDPETGERFDNEAEDADSLASQVGLVPLAQYEADNRPFLESAAEGVQAVGNTLLRPLEAAGNLLPKSNMARIGERVGDTWSPSSDDSRRIAQEHPIASALPLAGELLLPGGPLVQAAAGAVGSAAESTFQQGGEYGEINPDELLTSLALGGGLAAAAPAARAVSNLGRGVAGAAARGAEKLSDLGAGAIGKGLSSRIGRELTEDYAKEAVETGFKGVGAAIGGTIGGAPGMAAGWVAGRQMNKKFGDRLVNAMYKAARGGEEAGVGLRGAASVKPPPAPIDPESVAVGTGLGSVFQRAEQSMSPAMRRAREILERRGGQSGAVNLGADAPTVPPRGRTAKAAGYVEPLPERDVTPTNLYPDSNAARSEYGDAMYPHRDAMRADNARAADLAKEYELGAVQVSRGPNFSLGDVAKSPVGVVTGLGAAGMVGNVLARAERKANDSIDFEDLADMSEADRTAAVRANGARYQEQSTKQALTALEEKTGAYVAAKDEARARTSSLVAKPSDAQRAYADVAMGALDRAEQALRSAGDVEGADALSETLDAVTDVAVAHQQKLPVSHDAGELLSSLDHAYSVLRSRGQLPADAQVALEELGQGTTRPELWGQAADMYADLRAADEAADATNVLDSSDPDTWRQALTEHIGAARMQVDALDKWGVDTEKLSDRLDELQRAVDRGDSVAAELQAAGVVGSDTGADPWDAGPAGEILGAASREAGAEGIDQVLSPSVQRALEEQQRAFRYDSALRSVQRGAEVTLKKAARGMAGLGMAESKVDPDASNAAFTAGYSDETAAFEARRAMIEQIAQDPTALVDALSKSYGDLVKTHPEVYDQIASMAVRATDILTEAMPPSLLVSLRSPRGLPPSVDDIRAFSRVYMAVTEPATYLQDLGAGQAWPEQSQAFARMYPGQWQALGQLAVEAAQQRGPQLTPQEATYLDLTFNIGNTIGGIWSDAGAAAIRDANAARAQAAQEKSQSLGQPKPAASAPRPATAALSAGPSSAPVS